MGVKGENTNKGKVTAQLTDLTTVKVESENLGRARVGDEVEVTGVQVDERDIAAEKVVVTLRRGASLWALQPPTRPSPSQTQRTSRDKETGRK